MIAYKFDMGQKIKTDAKGISVDRAFLAHLKWSATQAVAADTDGIIDGAEGPNGEEAEALILDSGDLIKQPPCARNLTVTIAATTAGDVSGNDIIITGKNLNGDAISETFAVTADTPATITGSKAFASIDTITIPVQDGASVMVDVGWGDKLGIPYKLAHNTICYKNTYLDNVVEATEPTVTVSATVLESNTIDLNSALNGKVVDAYLMV